MLEHDKLKLLKDILGEYYKSRDEHMFYCKKCNHHKPKLSVNIQKDKFKCWVCMYSGNIRNLVKRFGSNAELNKWDELSGYIDLSIKDDYSNLYVDNQREGFRDETISLPEDFVSLVGKEERLAYCQAINYLKSRNIVGNDILRYRIGCAFQGEYRERIIVPSFDLNGRVNYFVARTYVEGPVSYRNPPASKNVIFNHLFLDFRDPIVVVEGAFDSFVAGDNSVPILGSTLDRDTRLFYEIVKNNSIVYLALDPDAHAKELRIIEGFLKYGITVYKIIISPFKDVGVMSKTEFEKRKEKAIFINNDTFLMYKMMIKQEFNK